MTRERNQAILADRERGLSFRVIGEQHGLSGARARQIVFAQQRMRAMAAWEAGWRSLAEVPDDYPLAEIPLPARVRHCLAGMALATMGEVRRASDAELLRQPNVGHKSVSWLRRFGTV
jgi:Bacterial RNA polymerase, alpha chain C terminal domain